MTEDTHANEDAQNLGEDELARDLEIGDGEQADAVSGGKAAEPEHLTVEPEH
jgi:hypothetical protein